ncbi:hypothetical protein M8C21_004196 [Ambrosia artemisiifolia]|uniref:Uncharacterized protein n=1 Tax=Ambrosia artemisiifolia TaxID=4212 RepID=A0AAD5CZ59_AMBAR|nr:hypothetical protein M8C21_004196 [Ambrosia artemisiifolia]
MDVDHLSFYSTEEKEEEEERERPCKKPKQEFLDHPIHSTLGGGGGPNDNNNNNPNPNNRFMCKQFWKAGDYESPPVNNNNQSISISHLAGGMDHLRVHPRFLHSNATSHKWALGAFAELLDNSLDEVCTGATYVNVDVLDSEIDTRNYKMLLVLKAQETIEKLDQEQANLIDIFTEERQRRDEMEETLRKKWQEAKNTIEELRRQIEGAEKQQCY